MPSGETGRSPAHGLMSEKSLRGEFREIGVHGFDDAMDTGRIDREIQPADFHGAAEAQAAVHRA